MSSEYASSSESDSDIEDDIILEIDLDNTVLQQAIHRARTTASNLQQSQSRPGYEQESHNIVASTIYLEGATVKNLRLITTSPQNPTESADRSSSGRERWIHLATDNILFADFKRVAVKVAFDHHEELVPVVLYLLQKVQERYEHESAYGSYVEPGTVLRCDGVNTNRPTDPDASVTFVSFPFIDVGKWRPPDAPKNASLHVPRGLFQSAYTHELAVDRDEQQTFRKMKGVKGNEYLRVPQLWALILQSGTIVTCGPRRLSDTFGDSADLSVEFVKEENLLAQGPSLVHVTDNKGRVKYLSIDHCRTFFDLQQSIAVQCLGKDYGDPDDDLDVGTYTLRLNDSDTDLEATQWSRILKEKRSTFVYVRVEVPDVPGSSHDGNSSAALIEHRTQDMIEYRSLNSDESGDEENQRDLMVIDKRNTNGAHGLDGIPRSTQSTIQGLKRRGIIVNDAASLQPKSMDLDDLPRPKVFKRPSQATQEAIKVKAVSDGLNRSMIRAIEAPLEEYEGQRLEGSATDRHVRFIKAASEQTSGGEVSVSTRPNSTDTIDIADWGNKSENANSSTENLGSSSFKGHPQALREILELETEDSVSNIAHRDDQSDIGTPVSRRGYVDGERRPSSISERRSSPENGDSERPEIKNKIGSKYEDPRDGNYLEDYPDKHNRPGSSRVASSGSEDQDLTSAASRSDESRSHRRSGAEAFQTTVESDTEEERMTIDDTQDIAGYEVDDRRIDPSHKSIDSHPKIPPILEPQDAQRTRPGTSTQQILSEREMRQVIKEELNLALKRNDTELEHKVHEEISARLRRFGFQENQIEAINAPKDHASRTENVRNQPTYSKVNKEYLAVDTLLYYDIPYEIDHTDPNYIIIMRAMEPRELEVLFEHTRRLRSRIGGRLESRIGARETSRKESAPRSKPQVEHNHEVRRARSQTWIHADTDTARGNGFGWHNSGTSSEPNLMVPPFLAWPTVFVDNKRAANDRVDPQTDPEPDFDEDLMRITLSSIVEQLIKIRTDETSLPISPHHPFRAMYKTGQAFVGLRQIAPAELRSLLQNQEVLSQTWCISDEIALFRKMRHENLKDLTGYSIRDGNDQNIIPLLSRRVSQWQMADLCFEQDALLSNTQKLIHQFVVGNDSHWLMRQCWGSLDTITEVIAALCSETAVHRTREMEHTSTLLYTISDQPYKEYVQVYRLPELAVRLEGCSTCSKDRPFLGIEEAYSHLHSHHFGGRDPPTKSQEAKLSHWILTTAGAANEKKNVEMLRLIVALNKRVAKILRKTVRIRNSVTNDEGERDPRFLLPKAMVKAAQRTLQLIYTAAHTVQYLHDRHLDAGGPLARSDLDVQENLALAEFYGTAVDDELSKAHDEFLVMAHTKSTDGTSVLKCLASTPETTLALCFAYLISKKIHQDSTQLDMYRSHLSSLRYGASQSPSKRIFRELFLMEEEIELQISIARQQQRAMKAVSVVFNDNTYRITNQVRVDAFNNMDHGLIQQLIARIDNDVKEARKVLSQITKTAQVLRYSLEIAEEGQSKAILAFTLVTIVFLPLSFVASLFGMNTTDIRNTESDQTIFWAVAIPLTAVIGGVSLLIAYGKIGQRIEYLDEVWQRYNDFIDRNFKTHMYQFPGGLQVGIANPFSRAVRARNKDEADEEKAAPIPLATISPAGFGKRRTATRTSHSSVKLDLTSAAKKRSDTGYVRPSGRRDLTPSRYRRSSPKRVVGIKEMFY